VEHEAVVEEAGVRQRAGGRDADHGDELLAQALPLLDRTQAGARAIRGLGLIASELGRARRDDRQLDLFGR
jgi:hypothetical protein